MALNPELYAKLVLKVEWWETQKQIAQALIRHGRVMVRAGNGPGKSFLAAGLVNWHFDVFQKGITITTAPTSQQVYDVLWKQIRIQRQGRPGLLPKACRMEDGTADHFAVGYTAANPDAFQGRHHENQLIVFDEATGIQAPFWDAAEGMQPKYFLVLLNPTDTTSRAYEEEQSGKWHMIRINSFDHPNIRAELEGKPPVYPNSSLRLQWLRDRIEEWCIEVEHKEKPEDFEFEGRYYRPGPLFEARVLGRWPTATAISVWTEAAWDAALVPQPMDQAPLEIGCDVARFGDDFTAIHARRGRTSLRHEFHQGWSTAETAGRLKQIAGTLVEEGEDPRKVLIKIDDDGVGGGVVDQAGGYRFVGCSSAAKAYDQTAYPNRRSEIWFSVAELAGEGRMDLSRIPNKTLYNLRAQAMAPKWRMDSQGRRVVEPKEETKRRLGRSPDDMDALNLAFSKAVLPGKAEPFW